MLEPGKVKVKLPASADEQQSPSPPPPHSPPRLESAITPFFPLFSFRMVSYISRGPTGSFRAKRSSCREDDGQAGPNESNMKPDLKF